MMSKKKDDREDKMDSQINKDLLSEEEAIKEQLELNQIRKNLEME